MIRKCNEDINDRNIDSTRPVDQSIYLRTEFELLLYQRLVTKQQVRNVVDMIFEKVCIALLFTIHSDLLEDVILPSLRHLHYKGFVGISRIY